MDQDLDIFINNKLLLNSLEGKSNLLLLKRLNIKKEIDIYLEKLDINLKDLFTDYLNLIILFIKYRFHFSDDDLVNQLKMNNSRNIIGIINLLLPYVDDKNNFYNFKNFSSIDDLVNSIYLLIDTIPDLSDNKKKFDKDSLSSVAPFRIVNIGNSNKVKLLDFIEAIEKNLGKKAIRNYMSIQMGDVPATWANTSLLQNLTGYKTKTNFNDGIAHFVKWYREYYNV